MTWLVRTGAALAALAVLVTACGSDDDEPAAEATTSTTAAGTTTTVDMQLLAEEFDIGDGRTLFLRCRGVGSPTILFEAGDQDDSQTWTGILPPLEGETRTCAYDRAGTGRRSPATGCRGLDDIIGDLEKLLDVAGIEGPYIFVGSSGGGYLAAEMAARHAAETVGLMTIDTFKSITLGPPGLMDEIKCDAPRNVEHRDYYGVEHAVWDDRVQIGEFPMTVITNDYGDTAEYDEIGNVEDQQGWFVLTPNHKQVVATGGHDAAGNEPELIVTEVLAILQAARAG